MNRPCSRNKLKVFTVTREVEPSEAELADPIEVVDCELATQEEYENWRKGRGGYW